MSEAAEKPELNRVYEVPKMKGPELRVVRLKGGQMIACQVISDTFFGVEIHYDSRVRRSEPCVKPESACPGCQGKKPKKILYYLHVFSNHHGQCFVELTHATMLRVTEILEGEPSFRGKCLELRRTAADNGRMLVKMCETMVPRTNLPKPADPENTLRYLWEWGRK
jgi:hypothetical protein